MNQVSSLLKGHKGKVMRHDATEALVAAQALIAGAAHDLGAKDMPDLGHVQSTNTPPMAVSVFL